MYTVSNREFGDPIFQGDLAEVLVFLSMCTKGLLANGHSTIYIKKLEEKVQVPARTPPSSGESEI